MDAKTINALVAEKIMGVPMPPESDKPSHLSSRLSHESGVWSWSWAGGGYPDRGEWIPMPFTENPSCSKQLRDKMRADGYRFTLWDISATGSLRVRCTVVKSILDGEVWQEVSDTEEMAVALAALKAVGVEAE